jgi:predicted protein tyrosine phosphatase
MLALYHVSRMNVLFVCSQNKLRSPTAEQIFADWPGVETSSAGLNNDAETPVSAESVEWADLIFVMEKVHQTKLARRFKRHLKNARVICLGIRDDFEYMEPALIALLNERVARHLPQARHR